MTFKYQPSKFSLFLAAFTWMLVISSFSSTYFGASNTAPVVEKVLHTISPSLSEPTIHSTHVTIRKLAHFSEFGIFSILVFGIFAVKEQRWRVYWLLYSLAVVVCLALLDEYHQAFVKNRNSSLGDSLVDIAGGITFLVIIFLIKRDKFKATK